MGEKVLRLQRNKKDTDLVLIQQLVSKFLKQCTLERFSQYICYHISRGHKIKKYLMAVYLVLSLFDLPFLTNAIVDILSSYTIAGPIVYPCS